MTASHIHFCWELGAGLGHAGRIKALALPLIARGHKVTLGLRDLVLTDSLLADLDVPKFQAPLWLHRTEGLPPEQASIADILLACGYLSAQAAAPVVQGWRHLFQAICPDLVVCDYAPGAMLAARTLRLPSATLGTGFTMPPPEQALPPLRGWEAAPRARMDATESRLLDTCNKVLARFGAAPLRHAAEVLRGDLPLMCSWPELDHYGRAAPLERWLGPVIPPPPATIAPQWPAGQGPKVFAYLHAGHPEHAAVLAALAAEGCRTLCYMPEVAAGKAPPVDSPLIAYARAPVRLAEALAESALAVLMAGESTMAQSLLAGVPMLLLPHHAESFLGARRLRLFGAALSGGELPRPADWRVHIRRLIGEPSFKQAALAFAQRYRGFDAARQAAGVAGLIEERLASARR